MHLINTHFNCYSLPEWTKEVYPSEKLDTLALTFNILHTFTPNLAKVRCGYFLKDLLDRCTEKHMGTLHPNQTVFMYSLHDNILSNVLHALGLYDVSIKS